MKTSKVTDMSYMFNNCSSLESLTVSFDTGKVENMEKMFRDCISLSSLDISTFKTETCQNFEEMFENDENLNLTLSYKSCQNLIKTLPSYVNTIDSS